MIKKTKEPKVTKELGVGKDGYQTGGVTIQATDPNESQVVDVKGTRRMRADKKTCKKQLGIKLCGYRQLN